MKSWVMNEAVYRWIMLLLTVGGLLATILL